MTCTGRRALWSNAVVRDEITRTGSRRSLHKADDLEAPLDERLKLYLAESRKLLPDLESTYDQLVARIQANSADILVPAVGDKLPDFLMTDSEGHLVDLASLLSKGPLVISFNRGPWCDYCGLELHALARAYPDIVAAGRRRRVDRAGDREICRTSCSRAEVCRSGC